LLLEFNELTPRLMDQFIVRGLLPNFRRFREQSHVFITDAGETQEHLEPWIQWVTVHCGLPYAEHGVFHLDEGQKLSKPCIWDLASDNGGRVWICGSMNVRFARETRGRFLPDPWSSADAHPAELNAFFHFVRRQVQEYSNERAPLSAGEAFRFLTFLVTHGLSVSTTSAVVHQILGERKTDSRWKRATLLDRMQWDLFKYYFRKDRPVLSTFFVNSTAHFQHCYWRNFEPEHFSIQPLESEQRVLQDAIAFGYQQMDSIVGEALDLCGDDTVLMMATGLSQQPYLKMEGKGGKLLFRPHDLHALAPAFGLTGVTQAMPVMAEQFYLFHDSEADAERTQKILGGVRVSGEPVFAEVLREGGRCFLGCSIFHEVPSDAAIEVDGRRIPFFDVFYLIKDSLKSGMHHPDGMWWMRLRDRKHSEAGRVPLTAVAPTILDLVGVEPSAFMRTAPVATRGHTTLK
jgi:hypothetical protein